MGKCFSINVIKDYERGSNLKITDTENIKNGEDDFIDGLVGELDWSTIENLLREKYNLELHDDVEYKNGDIVIHDNKVSYKINFDVRVTLSLLFGRDGECLEITTSGEDDIENDEGTSVVNDSIYDEVEKVADRKSDEKVDEMASQIVNMIDEINK